MGYVCAADALGAPQKRKGCAQARTNKTAKHPRSVAAQMRGEGYEDDGNREALVKRAHAGGGREGGKAHREKVTEGLGRKRCTRTDSLVKVALRPFRLSQPRHHSQPQPEIRTHARRYKEGAAKRSKRYTQAR